MICQGAIIPQGCGRALAAGPRARKVRDSQRRRPWEGSERPALMRLCSACRVATEHPEVRTLAVPPPEPPCCPNGFRPQLGGWDFAPCEQLRSVGARGDVRHKPAAAGSPRPDSAPPPRSAGCAVRCRVQSLRRHDRAGTPPPPSRAWRHSRGEVLGLGNAGAVRKVRGMDGSHAPVALDGLRLPLEAQAAIEQGRHGGGRSTRQSGPRTARGRNGPRARCPATGRSAGPRYWDG